MGEIKKEKGVWFGQYDSFWLYLYMQLDVGNSHGCVLYQWKCFSQACKLKWLGPDIKYEQKYSSAN